jgi:predicted ATPase
VGERAYAPTNPLLVGRQRELELLWRQLQATADGALRVALIAGEPGNGKTRLLDTVAQRAGREGIVVLRGGASEAEGMPPYLPFLDALGAHIRSTDAALLREQAGAAAPTLAALLPELVQPGLNSIMV